MNGQKTHRNMLLGFSFKYADIAKVFRSLALQYPLNSTSVVSRVK